jgi:hypothetical protein
LPPHACALALGRPILADQSWSKPISLKCCAKERSPARPWTSLIRSRSRATIHSAACQTSWRHRTIGYVSRSLYERFYQDTVDNIAKWLDLASLSVALHKPRYGREYHGRTSDRLDGAPVSKPAPALLTGGMRSRAAFSLATVVAFSNRAIAPNTGLTVRSESSSEVIPLKAKQFRAAQ